MPSTSSSLDAGTAAANDVSCEPAQSSRSPYTLGYAPRSQSLRSGWSPSRWCGMVTYAVGEPPAVLYVSVVRATSSPTPYVTSTPVTGSAAAVARASLAAALAFGGTAYQLADSPAPRVVDPPSDVPPISPHCDVPASAVAAPSADVVNEPPVTAEVSVTSCSAVKLTKGEPSASTTVPSTAPDASSSSMVTLTGSAALTCAEAAPASTVTAGTC